MADEKPFHNPFGALEVLRGRLAPAPAPPGDPAPIAPGKKTHAKTYARAVVRMERAGRGGKEVTVVEQLDLPPAEREIWLKALKTALGCGGSVEGDKLMLQGDHRDRLKGLLIDRGVKRVTIA